MADLLIIDTKEKYKIVYDPTRQEIITVMRNVGLAMTVKDISLHMNLPHGKVYYHVKKLLSIEALKLSHTELINGITASYYVVNFKNIKIPLTNTLNQTNQALKNSLNQKIKDEYQESFEELMEARDLLADRIKKKKRVFGSHHYNTDIYLTYEERDELWKIIDAYLDDKKRTKTNKKETTTTRIFCQIFDIDYND